jgi:hypothetical protein
MVQRRLESGKVLGGLSTQHPSSRFQVGIWDPRVGGEALQSSPKVREETSFLTGDIGVLPITHPTSLCSTFRLTYFLASTREREHVVFVFLCVDYFAYYNVLQFHPFCCK